MTQFRTSIKSVPLQLVSRWRAFWFGLEPAYTLGLVRIAFGGLVFVWTLWLMQGLRTGLGPEGVAPRPPSRQFVWGIFHVFPSEAALLIGWFVLLTASIALTVGWHSRLAAVLVFVLILSLERRNPAVFNGGDQLLRIEAIFMALSPCGAALSLDQRRRTGSFFSAQQFRPWPLRLMQIQLSIVYLATVVLKLSGETWQNGTAVMYSLRQIDLQFIRLPEWLTHNLMLSNALTWGTLVVEVGLGILVWNRRCRPAVLVAGVTMHLAISLFIEVGFFTFVTLILYLAFVSPESAEKVARSVQNKLSGLTSRRRDASGPELRPGHVDYHGEGITVRHPIEGSVAADQGGAHIETIAHTPGIKTEEGLASSSAVDPAMALARAAAPSDDSDDAATYGRHARRSTPPADIRVQFHWPDDVRSRLDN